MPDGGPSCHFESGLPRGPLPELLAAIKDLDEARVGRLLKEHTGFAHRHGGTLLLMAVEASQPGQEEGAINLIDRLIEAGADPLKKIGLPDGRQQCPAEAIFSNSHLRPPGRAGAHLVLHTLALDGDFCPCQPDQPHPNARRLQQLVRHQLRTSEGILPSAAAANLTPEAKSFWEQHLAPAPGHHAVPSAAASRLIPATDGNPHIRPYVRTVYNELMRKLRSAPQARRTPPAPFGQ